MSSRFLCEFFSFAKFSLGPVPELFIPYHRPVVFVPDLPGPLSDLVFVGLCQRTGSLLKFSHQLQYMLDRFPVTHSPREVAVLIGLLWATSCFWSTALSIP